VPQGSFMPSTLSSLYINDTPETVDVHLAIFVHTTVHKEGSVLRKL
jgi:hypothetical protein